jgi:hypothetical protein
MTKYVRTIHGNVMIPKGGTGKRIRELRRRSGEHAQRFKKVVEGNVREYPDQWFWIHQRWKTKTCQIRMD